MGVVSLLYTLNSSTISQNKLYVFYPWISNVIKLAKKQTERKQEQLQAYEAAAANRASVAQNNFRSADTK